MNILLLTSFYPPEIRSISTMMRQLAEGLVRRGHRVTALTAWPKDNLPEEARGLHFPVVVQEGQVTVVRVKTIGHRTSNYILRGLTELTLPWFYRRAIKKWVQTPIDGVIAYIPHFTLAGVGAWVKKKYGARYLLNVQDIFPQNAIDAGIMKNKIIIGFYEYLERRAYAAADALTTHTSGGKKFLIDQKGIQSDKITTVYNWIDPVAFQVGPSTGVFRRRYGLEGKFIFLFAGIFGPTQGLELVIDAARRVVDIPEISFLLVGEGTEKERLRHLVTQYNLPNVQFQPFVPPREYPTLLQEIDVGLMCLSPVNTTAVVPGKLSGYMAAGLPVAAFLQQQSEGHRIIQESHCGYSIISDSVDQAVVVIRQMFQERSKLKEYGRQGYEYAVRHFFIDDCIDQLARLITGEAKFDREDPRV